MGGRKILRGKVPPEKALEQGLYKASRPHSVNKYVFHLHGPDTVPVTGDPGWEKKQVSAFMEPMV